MALGHEHIGTVQADDQWDGSGGRRADDAPGNHPMRVHDRRALLLRDTQRLEPSGENCKRSHGDCGCAKMNVGAHPFGVAERVQRLDWRVVEEMEMDATIDFRPIPLRMPWRHEMYFMSTRRNALSNRFHKAADRIPREPRIRRSDHDDALTH